MTESSYKNLSIPLPPHEKLHARLYGMTDDLNWGISLNDSIMTEDITTPLIIALHDFPGKDMLAHDLLFDQCARQSAIKGLPTLTVDFRGCGNSHGSEHNLTLDTATQDVAKIVKWAKEELGFSNFIFLSAGFAALPVLNWFSQASKDTQKHCLAFMMLWPHLDPECVTFLAQMNYLNKRQTSAGDMLALGAHDLDASLYDQVIAMDIDAALQKITQPILCFYGSADEYSFPRQADIIRQLENPEFLDIQIFHRGGNGLTEEKIRPHVLRHLQDFLIKFA